MYGNLDQLKDSFGSKKDLLLQDISDEQLTSVMIEQSNYIDSFIAVRYSLPLEVNNAMIDRICIILSKTEIYRLYASNDIPDTVKEQEKQALKDLVKIQKGQILIMKEDELDDDVTSKPQFFTEFL